MRILFTSDWQVEYENLEVCRKVVEEILDLKQTYGFQVLVHCGDVKRQYNPVDVRVVNFILKAIGQFRKAGLEVVVCLGNHDRVGMHVDKQNWLPVLRRAGAKAYDEPSVVELGGGKELRVLPFRNNPVLLRREAHDLSKGAQKDRSVLVFHADLAGAKYNVLSRSSEGIGIQDLCPGKYTVCVGGHIHLQQNVGENVWYVGSPFVTDWGEANQQKGFLGFDLDSGKLRQIPSRIPGWFDVSWPGFGEIERRFGGKYPAGSRIKIRVPCSSVTHVGEELNRAKEKAEEKYKGAEIIVVPEFKEIDAGHQKIRTDWPDSRKVHAYASESFPEELEPYREKVLNYLVGVLGQAGAGPRLGGEIKFEKVHGENFLSFKSLDLEFQEGLVVVAGKNNDWKGRSNGSGKTSLLQPLAVSLFGLTFKGQKHDRWMRRGLTKKQKSFVSVTFQDSQERRVRVWRGRRPKKLLLRVNGELVDSGNRPESTQAAIEQITGYTWETLSNAIYVDQSRAHLMLTGTEAERKSFLAQLQNLERFERALKAVRDQKSDLDRRLQAVNLRITEATNDANQLALTITQTKGILAISGKIEGRYLRAKNGYAKAKLAARKWREMASGKRQELQDWVDKLSAQMEELGVKGGGLQERTQQFEKRYNRLKNLEGNCPTCLQKVDEEYQLRQLPRLKKRLKEYRDELLAVEEEVEKLIGYRKKLKEKLSMWETNENLDNRERKAQLAFQKWFVEREQYWKQKELLQEMESRRQKALAKVRDQEVRLKRIEKWLKVMSYGEKVFARNGLPAYLNAQIVPELNQVAAEYSEQFSQKEIQVLFQVDEEGRLDVQVVNAHGGERVQDQSEGEMKVASLITSFAVRALAPKTNILILDEPGDGLDPVSARQFARGVREVVKKFGCIICVTHNPAILSELADSRLLTVVKTNGVSELQ